jgi:hypothetical protein
MEMTHLLPAEVSGLSRSQRTLTPQRWLQNGLNSPVFPFHRDPAISPPISQLYAVARKMPPQRRLNGGGRSLARTALSQIFPVTGKFTGNFSPFALTGAEQLALITALSANFPNEMKNRTGNLKPRIREIPFPCFLTMSKCVGTRGWPHSFDKGPETNPRAKYCKR